MEEQIMAKQIQDTELLEIVEGAIKGDLIDDEDTYLKFLKSLAELVTDHFGGEVPNEPGEIAGNYYIGIEWNEALPEDGGVFKKYDTDISITEWKSDAGA